jgi:HEAT repeat protein
MGASSSGIGQIILEIFSKNKNKVKGLLIELLKEGNDSLKIASAFIIGELKIEEAIDELVKATKDGNEWVRKYSYKAIVNIKGEEEAKNLVPDYAG